MLVMLVVLVRLVVSVMVLLLLMLLLLLASAFRGTGRTKNWSSHVHDSIITIAVVLIVVCSSPKFALHVLLSLSSLRL